MFALSSTGVALAVVVILMETDEELLYSVKMAQVILRVIFGTAIILICSGYIYMHFKSKAGTGFLQTRGHEGDDVSLKFSGSWAVVTAPKRSLQAKYMVITLFIFGIGTILSCILYLIEFSLAHTALMPLGIMDNIVYIVILCFQLAFFYLYEGEVLNNRGIFHYTIAIMVGVEVWAWVMETLFPLWMFNLAGNSTDSQHNEHINITALPIVLEFAKEFLEPFYVEFATIAIGVLFHLWSTINNNHESSNRIETNVLQMGCHISNDLYEPGRAKMYPSTIISRVVR